MHARVREGIIGYFDTSCSETVTVLISRVRTSSDERSKDAIALASDVSTMRVANIPGLIVMTLSPRQAASSHLNVDVTASAACFDAEYPAAPGS